MRVALIGNPNAGKSTVFNALTGARQKVGNWPGVTVERKSGFYSHEDATVEVIDLPGTYSLTIYSQNAAIDERIACEFITERQADVIVNICDASNLERNLYLTLQLREREMPVVLALNMIDVAQKKGISIDAEKLSALLDCPVILMQANKKKGMDALKVAIAKSYSTSVTNTAPVRYSNIIEEKITALMSCFPKEDARGLAISALEGDRIALSKACQPLSLTLEGEVETPDILIADTRYSLIHSMCADILKKSVSTRQTWTEYLDAVILNRFLGIPIFLLIMYTMFFLAINVGGIFQDFFDITSQTIFVEGLSHTLVAWHSPPWLIALLADGVGKGINTTVTFIPVIGGLFFFLSCLEASGYMARAAFVMDRVMRAIGLPGKAFVPLIVGFGCNVPAIMACRTLDSPKDRILTAMMTPFMACGARLAIFAIFAAAFFPHGGQNIVFLLYAIGILIAIFTGWVLRLTILPGNSSAFILELPPYHLPTLHGILLQTWVRLRGFVIRAGKVIVPICVLLGTLNAITITGHLSLLEANPDSILSSLGRILTPLFTPFGITQDNWPATVGLLTGTLAKEVVIGTLNALYAHTHVLSVHPEFSWIAGFKSAFQSIIDNIRDLPHVLENPILATAPDQNVDPSLYGILYTKFHGKIAAISYLLFILLYVPCISTVATLGRELHKGWAYLSIVWSISLAYCVATLFYQIATWPSHPEQSFLWVMGIFGFMLGLIAILYFYGRKPDLQEPSYVTP